MCRDMPDESTAVYRGDRRPGFLFVPIGALLLLFAWPAHNGALICIGLGIVVLGGNCLTPVRLELHPDRIFYQTMFGSWEMRLDAVEKFYYKAVRQKHAKNANYIFKLVDDQGKSISIRRPIVNAKELGLRLVDLTSPPLTRKCMMNLDMGRELDLGPVRLSRAEGIRVRKPRAGGLGHRTERIPLDQVSEFTLRDGHFYVWRKGEKRTRGPLASEIPNVFVLLGLMRTLCPEARYSD